MFYVGEELKKFEKQFSTNNGLTVIYGKRRVGKTELIKEVFCTKLIVFILNV